MAHPQSVWTTPAAWTALVDEHQRPRSRRREERHVLPRGTTVALRIAPDPETVDAEVRNLSKHGVAFCTHSLAAPGAFISFYFAGARIYAQVRHCRLTRLGFMVGARITDVFRDDGEVATSLNL